MALLNPPKVTAVAPSARAAVAAQQARINQALAAPGARGMKGFLIWVKAAWPAPIAQRILAAAGAHLKASALAASRSPIASAGNAAKAGTVGRYVGRAGTGMMDTGKRRYNLAGRLMGLGQTSDLVPSSSVFAPISIAPASTDPTIAATPSTSANSSWLSSIGTAVSGAVQGYLGLQQAKDAQTLFDTNLQRAQQGLAPLSANPSAYGIVSPSVNVGLSPGVQTLLIYGGIGLGAILLINVAVKAVKKH